MNRRRRLTTKASMTLAACCVCLLSRGAAVADESQRRGLFVMRTDGTGVRRLVNVEGFTRYATPRWSHDGKRLVFAGRKQAAAASRLFVVDADGKNLAGVGPGAQADWSPDDKQFAFASGLDPSLKDGIWVQNVDGRGDQWLVAGLAPRWSPDGSLIALVADGGLHVVDQIDFAARALFDPEQKVTAVRSGFDWSPDGKQLAAAVERDGKSEVVIVSSAGSRAGMRTRLAAKAASVSWSPDGKTLAVALWNDERRAHRLYLLDVEGDAAPREIPGQSGDNREAEFSPDGQLLAFVSTRQAAEPRPASVAGGDVKLQQIASYDTGGTCYSLALAPDGRTALLGGNLGSRRLQVWDLETRIVERVFPILGIFVAVSPDGEHAACTEITGRTFKKSVTLIRLADGQPIRDLPSAGPIWFIQFSAGGAHLVCGAEDGSASVFEVATGKRLAQFKQETRVTTGAISADGRIAAIGAGDGKVNVWDVPLAKKVRALDHPELTWSVAFSPDGRLIATGTGGAARGSPAEHRFPLGDDNTIRLWDVASGKLVRELKGHDHAVTSIAFSPEGRRLASGSLDGTVRLWDVERGVELSRAAGKSWIFSVVYSNDGQLVLAAGGNRRLRITDPRIVDFPTERVRVFQIASAEQPEEVTAKP